MARHADRPGFEESVHVAASPERVWPFVSDIAFVVEASDELQAVRWTSGAGDAPQVGRTFVGRNRNDYFGEWETTSTITECDAPRVFAWTVGDPDNPNTCWRFTLEPDDSGTRVTQSGQLGYGPSGLHIAIEAMPDKEERIVAGRLGEWRSAMEANLAAFKERAETGLPPGAR